MQHVCNVAVVPHRERQARLSPVLLSGLSRMEISEMG